jgi:hypothetical protein
MSISVWTNKNPLDAEWVGPNPSDKYEQIKDIKRLNPVELEAMVLKHEQQIKDIAAHLLAGKTLDAAIDRELVLKTGIPKTGIPVDDCNQGLSLIELKQLVTPMMERREWVGLTDDEKAYSNTNYLGKSAEAWHGGVEWAEAKLKEKNT